MPGGRRRATNWLVAALVGLLILILVVQFAGLSVPNVLGPDGGPTNGDGADGGLSVDGTVETADPPADERSARTRSRAAETRRLEWTEVTPTGPGAAGGPPAEMTDALRPPADAEFRTTFRNPEGLSDWSLRGKGADSAGATVVEETLGLHVTGCDAVAARRNLGTYNGTVRVSFEWAATADRWWERPRWRLVDGSGTTYSHTVVRGHDVGHPDPGRTRTNVTVAEATVDGPLVVEFLITPSDHCHRSDHRLTALYVDELAVEAVSN